MPTCAGAGADKLVMLDGKGQVPHHCHRACPSAMAAPSADRRKGHKERVPLE